MLKVLVRHRGKSLKIVLSLTFRFFSLSTYFYEVKLKATIYTFSGLTIRVLG